MQKKGGFGLNGSGGVLGFGHWHRPKTSLRDPRNALIKAELWSTQNKN